MVLIVVADTHFGLKKAKINMGMPGYFANFLDWIASLEGQPVTVKVLEGPLQEKSIKEKTIYFPQKIIFLGDILELWDSEDEPVAACVATLMPSLANIKAEKIYVLGNHDNILKRIVLETPQGGYMHYNLGGSVLKVFPDVYPPPSAHIVTEKCGANHYIFVHGHQFDKYFAESGGSYKIWSVVRNVSDSLTLYVPALFGISCVVKIVNWIAGTSIFLGKNPTWGLLFLLTLPRIYMDIGRRLWNWIVGMRYKKQETITNFMHWWKKFVSSKSKSKNKSESKSKSKSKPVPENLAVVYGHTHYLNYLPSHYAPGEDMFSGGLHDYYKETSQKEGIPEEERPTLVNISAWVTDFYILSEKFFLAVEKASHQLKKPFVKEKKERLNPESATVGTFLYIDEDGFEFFGWNWYSEEEKPVHNVFHIPKAAIIKRRERGPVTDDEEVRKALEDIGWPQTLVNLWKRDPHE